MTNPKLIALLTAMIPKKIKILPMRIKFKFYMNKRYHQINLYSFKTSLRESNDIDVFNISNDLKVTKVLQLRQLKTYIIGLEIYLKIQE